MARNDCASYLACINNMCTQNDFEIGVVARECVRVECAQDPDCCPVQPAECQNAASICDQPYLDPSCVSSYATCAADPDCTTTGEICDTSLLYCVCAPNPEYQPSHEICLLGTCEPCQQACREEQCVAVCTIDEDCPLGFTCAAGACVDCELDTDCADGQRCSDGACVSPCTQHEECPHFNLCNTTTGQCDYVGCTSDRECQFVFSALGVPSGLAAECVANERAGQEGQPERLCRLPCVADAECPALNVCSQGSCAYVGCESDLECRAELDLAELDPELVFPIPRAVCRELP